MHDHKPPMPIPSKTEFLIIGLREQLGKLTYSADVSPTDHTSSEPYTSPIRNLGIIFDKKPYVCRPHHPAISNLLYVYSRPPSTTPNTHQIPTTCYLSTALSLQA